MSEPACCACAATDRALRSLPRLDAAAPQRLAVQPVCELCVMPVIGELRALVDRTVSDPDDDDAGMDMLLLIALLKRHGLEITDEHTEGRAGMDGVRYGLRTILDSLERRLMCSACGAGIPESRAVVMPAFNESVGGYVETFRCHACAPATIAASIARVRDVDSRAQLDTLGRSLQQHGVFMHEWMRGDPDDVIRPLFVHALERIGDGTMALRIGTTSPIPRPAG